MGCDVVRGILDYTPFGGFGLVTRVWDAVSGDDSEDSADQAAAASNAQRKMYAQQWAHYRDTYKPLLTGLVKESEKKSFAGNLRASIARAAKQNQAAGDANILASGSKRGLDPSQLGVSSNLASNAALTGAKTGQSLASVRPSLDNASWNNKVGLVQVGRGMPGQIQSGYGALANQYAAKSAAEAAQTQQTRSGIAQLAGIGLGLAL